MSVTAVLLWYLVSTLAGWLCFPLTFRIFQNLPGKGYAFSRILGLLLWGYAFWLLVSLGILRNNLVGQWVALALVAALALGAGMKDKFQTLRAFIRREWRLILAVEGVFLFSFVGFAFFRGTSPAIRGTEKPMELAFLNAILRSETFPPQDPWLSGYGISYYYFGYVLAALLTRLTGTISTVAYNLAQALWFALIASGAYGLAADLLAHRRDVETTARPIPSWARLYIGFRVISMSLK